MTGRDRTGTAAEPEEATDGSVHSADAPRPVSDSTAPVGTGADSEDAEAVAGVHDVVRRFGDLTVLDGVSVGFGAGTVTAVVGPNGCGKTTLLRVLAGLLTPTRGRVERPARGERPLGYLPQSPAFRPGFTARETLGFYADLVEADVDVDALLDRVGLGAVGDRRVEALSGGMTRLLGLAQATVGDPPLLVLDEPTSGLDPGMTERIFGVVGDLAGEDRAFAIATHDLHAVERAADVVVLLDRGAVVARGSPADLLDRTGADSLTGAFTSLVEEEGTRTVRTGRRGDESGGSERGGDRGDGDDGGDSGRDGGDGSR